MCGTRSAHLMASKDRKEGRKEGRKHANVGWEKTGLSPTQRTDYRQLRTAESRDHSF